MSEQEKFEAWWKEKGFNSVILRAAALTAWMARAEIDKDPQPAEDPDEWVIQDRVPIRVTIDRCWYMDGECGLPANPEDMWQKYNKDGFLDGKGHGDYVRDGGGTLHVMCRRRDLPKVEQAEPEPEPRVFRVTDGERYLTCQSFRDRFVLIPEDGGVPFTTIELSWHNLRKCPAVDVPSEKPEPQPELQPAEDPDEWVEITDPDHVLRSCDFFQIKDQSWHRIASSVGKTVAGCRYFAEAFRCRRRDLPKVEQVEQWPKYYKPSQPRKTGYGKHVAYYKCSETEKGETIHTDGTSFGFTVRAPGVDWTEITEEQAMWLLDKPTEPESKPQPQKTRVRLWIPREWNTRPLRICVSDEQEMGTEYVEIHHDSEGFYVENPS